MRREFHELFVDLAIASQSFHPEEESFTVNNEQTWNLRSQRIDYYKYNTFNKIKFHRITKENLFLYSLIKQNVLNYWLEKRYIYKINNPTKFEKTTKDNIGSISESASFPFDPNDHGYFWLTIYFNYQKELKKFLKEQK